MAKLHGNATCLLGAVRPFFTVEQPLQKPDCYIDDKKQHQAENSSPLPAPRLKFGIRRVHV